jgi:hypothetical protein
MPNVARTMAIAVGSHEHRAHARQHVRDRLIKVTVDQNDIPALVRNVSTHGMMIDAAYSFVCGTSVLISSFDGQGSPAKIVWQRGSHVGIRFAEPVDIRNVFAASPMSKAELQARLPRIDTKARATIEENGSRSTVTIFDLSQHGAKLQSDIPLLPRRVVWIAIVGLKLRSATVKWFHEGMSGIAFREQLTAQEISDWFKAHRPENARFPDNS